VQDGLGQTRDPVELTESKRQSAGRNCVTAEMTVRYRKPVKTGSPLRGFGRVTGEKGRLIYTEACLLDDSGTLVAEASGKMMRVSDASVQ